MEKTDSEEEQAFIVGVTRQTVPQGARGRCTAGVRWNAFAAAADGLNHAELTVFVHRSPVCAHCSSPAGGPPAAAWSLPVPPGAQSSQPSPT